MRGGMGQKYKLRKADVFGQCLMSSGNASCFRAVCFRAMSHAFGRCLMFSGNASSFCGVMFSGRMFSGNVSCFRAMSHVFGQCLMFSGRMFSGNVSCFRAVCFRAMSHVIGQCKSTKCYIRVTNNLAPFLPRGFQYPIWLPKGRRGEETCSKEPPLCFKKPQEKLKMS